MRFLLLSTYLLSLFLCLVSCGNTEDDAADSIIGEWTVTEIISQYGSFSENAYNNESSITEDGDLGTFHFDKDSVRFDYTRNDTLYTGSSSWSLNHERVNSGFVRVDQFRLSIDDYFLFDVRFEDGTSNSEKNAEYLSLSELAQDTTHLLINLSLEK